jgi:hypothetical protein
MRSFRRVSIAHEWNRPIAMLLIFASDWVAREDFHPDETDTLADFNRNKFLDLSKPLLVQVWNAPWTKEYYLSQVHNPRHLKESARLFGWDILEVSDQQLSLTCHLLSY